MLARIQIRRDSGANWASADPVLLSGELGINTDDSTFKIGDGVTAWSGLSYSGGGGGGGGSGDVVGPSSATDNAVARFNATTGKIIQNSVVTIADTTGNMAGVGTLNTHTIPGGTGTLALTSDITGTNSGTNTGDQTISLTGDVTGSGTGSFAATIANDAVTYAKMQNVTATDKLLGRSTSGAGDVEEIACTAAGRALLDDADANAQRTTLGLGSLATQSGTFSGTSSGTNTGDQNLFQTIVVSGQSDVVADSTSDTLTLVAGSNITITTDASTDSITIAAAGGGGGDVSTDTIWDAKGDLAGGTGSNTAARLAVGTNGQVLTADSAEVTGLKWTTVSGTGDVVGPASATDNAIVRFDSTTGKLVQNSVVTIADSTGNMAGVGTLNTHTIPGGTGTLALTSDITGTNSGTNTGDQTITLTGGVTGSGTGTFAATVVTNANLTGPITSVGNATTIADPELSALAGLTSAADKGIQFTGSGTAGLFDLTAAGKALLDDATAAAQVTTLGLDNTKIASVGITIDGGGSAITTGLKGYIEVPYACTITRVTMLADTSGSAVVDIWKDTYANYPPVVGDSITASAKPTISAAVKSQDATLTGWTTSVAAGDILAFNVDSASTITRLNLILRVTKT